MTYFIVLFVAIVASFVVGAKYGRTAETKIQSEAEALANAAKKDAEAIKAKL